MANNITTKKELNGSTYAKAAIFAFDFLLLNLLFLTYLWGFESLVPEYFYTNTKISFIIMNGTMLLAQYFYHTIVVRRLVRLEQIAANTFRLVLTLSAAMFILLRLLTTSPGMYRFMFIFGASLYVLMLISRLLEVGLLSTLRRQGRNSVSVVFVGNDPALIDLYHDLTMNAAVGYRVKGYWAYEPMENPPKGLKYLGNIDELTARLDELDADPLLPAGVHELFCSLGHDNGADVRRIMESCDRKVVRFYYVPRIFQDHMMHMQPYQLGSHLMYTNHLEPLRRPTSRILKRLFDILFSLCVCIFLVPITIIVGLIIKIQSPGPIFFKQERTGLDGKNFNCLKFRSMHVNADADKLQATKDDPRKYPFGNFMRKANIDELPQFFNVLMGDMSIVGPRPHMLHHTEVYGKLIDKYMVRHLCKPGITGWAQVTGFRGETQEVWQMEERVKRDIWYIENWSFWLDIKIIYLTAKSIIIHDEHAY